MAVTGEQFVGTWKLLEFEVHLPHGEARYPWGKNPVGLLMYDAAGNMCGMLMRADRPAFAQGDLLRGNPEEVKSAFEGFQAYFGTYEVNDRERMVIHHVIGCSFPNWVGTDQIRFFEFSGKNLTLSTPPLSAAGMTVTMRLVWARAA
jgi:hypothetical protein